MFKRLGQKLEASLLAGWQSPNWLSRSLLPISWLFAALAALRRIYLRKLKPSPRLPVPVIVVGNIYLGGTGKTPLTIWLVAQLRAAGLRPGVISRGYGAELEKAQIRQVTANSSAAEVGDEPLLIAQRSACPVFVGQQRRKVALALLQAYPYVNVIISDDGLQHYALPRQIELIMFDERGIGNAQLLPAGPLREAASRARDFTIINAPSRPANLGDTADTSYLMALQLGNAYQLSTPARQLPLAELVAMHTGQGKILAAAGIGNPQRFFNSLRQALQGISPAPQITELALPDHFDFSQNPLQNLAHELILITEKDAVKCAAHASLKNDARIWVVPVEAVLDARLAQHIVEKCLGCSSA